MIIEHVFTDSAGAVVDESIPADLGTTDWSHSSDFGRSVRIRHYHELDDDGDLTGPAL